MKSLTLLNIIFKKTLHVYLLYFMPFFNISINFIESGKYNQFSSILFFIPFFSLFLWILFQTAIPSSQLYLLLSNWYFFIYNSTNNMVLYYELSSLPWPACLFHVPIHYHSRWLAKDNTAKSQLPERYICWRSNSLNWPIY